MTTLTEIVREHLTESKPTATARLITGGHTAATEARKTYAVTLDTVRAAEVPPATETYFPIRHDALIDAIELACQQRGLEITSRSYALNRQQTQFLGTCLLRGADTVAKDFTLAMGIRNSTDKSMPAGLVSGAHVMVCENNSFSGEVSLARKHTKFIMRDLPDIVAKGVDRFLTASVNQARTFDHWKTVDVTTDQASLLAVDAAMHGAIPRNGILSVRKEFITPRYAEFIPEGRHTAWTLYNAFTQFLTHDRERVSPLKAQRDFLRVHRTLAEAFPLQVVQN